MSPYSLPYLLFLASEAKRAGPTWRGGRHLPWGSPGWPRAPHPHALLVAAQEPPTFTLRLGRQQDDGSEATGFLLGDGEKAGGLLGTLAEELNGYSREKGGSSFCFGQG
ncbi:orexigenic neuropeptide QRFP [Kogia breviceps]|uniref:orexigenic neuropeptide QRFP n=1 Tax=Kogia breviceps TaxID=27615 RepID=UPI0034D1E174